MSFYDSFGNRESGVHIQEDSRVKVYSMADQGRRSMEDGYAIATSLPCDASLIGVYDGHGGNDAARFCTSNLFKTLLKDKAFGDGNYKDSLHNAFVTMDVEFSRHGSTSGTTAVLVLVRNTEFFVAHAGDSYCSLVTDGKMVHLTKDHSPSNLDEVDRVCKAKYCVQDGRVSKPGCETGLALTRAIGDYEFKDNKKKSLEEQAVTCVPEVVVQKISEGCDYLLLASDGLPRKYIESCQGEINKALLNDDANALQRIVTMGTSGDNKTLVVVKLKKKKPADELSLKRNHQEDYSRDEEHPRKRHYCSGSSHRQESRRNRHSESSSRR